MQTRLSKLLLILLFSLMATAGHATADDKKEWMSAIKEGKYVKAIVEPVYSGNSKRPDSFNISYFIDDSPLIQKNFQNIAPKGAADDLVTKGAGRFTQIGSGLSKADARALIRSGNSGLTEGQAASILKKLGKGRVDSVGIKTVNQNGNVRLTLERAGAQSGFQRFSFEIGADGKTLRTVQTAFDDAGNLVRQAPGAAKNNLFDVK